MTDYKEENQPELKAVKTAEEILTDLEKLHEFRWVNWIKGDTKKMVLLAMYEYANQFSQPKEIESLTKELDQAKEIMMKIRAEHHRAIGGYRGSCELENELDKFLGFK